MTIRMACVLAVAALPAAVHAQQERPELPDWMAGCWEMRESERWAEECWTIPRGGMMLGSGRAGSGDEVRSWEAMRIALDERNEAGSVPMAFVASPGGGPWIAFTWRPSEQDGVTFHNAANDYPQRVRYWREGELLMAEIALADGTNPTRWTFRRMGG